MRAACLTVTPQCIILYFDEQYKWLVPYCVFMPFFLLRRLPSVQIFSSAPCRETSLVTYLFWHYGERPSFTPILNICSDGNCDLYVFRYTRKLWSELALKGSSAYPNLVSCSCLRKHFYFFQASICLFVFRQALPVRWPVSHLISSNVASPVKNVVKNWCLCEMSSYVSCLQQEVVYSRRLCTAGGYSLTTSCGLFRLVRKTAKSDC